MTVTERRNYFRVDHELMLKCHCVDANTVEQGLPEDQFPEDKQASYLIQELHRLDNEAAPHLSSIAEMSRSVADYLAILNKKIDLIAQHSSSPYLHAQTNQDQSNSNEASRETPTLVNVNLGEDGIAFYDTSQWSTTDLLALRLQFLNDYSSITCFARVLRCEAQEDQTFKTACQFLRLSKTSREALRRHIMQAQLSAIRQQKQHNDD
ncbi:PilZ domain-containing protein [Pseudomaricurvus sp.]|uniref:PilZ domain-containing protein n=1 Tax=Pseudomaricurvus sp. TaxID=2004510 RepID=UPI003F6AEF98